MTEIERSNYKYCDKCESRLDKLYDICVDGEVKITICKDCVIEFLKEIEEKEE